METDIQKMLDMFNELREKANVNTCFGEPVTAEGRTVIPVAQVGYGFGMTAAPGSAPEVDVPDLDEMEAGGAGGGGGGGVSSSPLAVIEVTAEGTRIRPVMHQQKLVVTGLLVAAWSIFWVARALVAISAPRE